MRLDQAYRLAHLPLVRPAHPGSIAEGRPYLHGKHHTAWSVVLPVDAGALEQSAAMRDLHGELRAAPFADKIAWDLLPRRRDRLHATLVGGMGIGDVPAIEDVALRALRAIGPIDIELRGLFSGNVNVGRLYLRVYPQSRSGINLLHSVQLALGGPVTTIYLVGLYNLTDDLDATEAQALRDIIAKWWGRPLLRFTATRLWLLGARDDLVLDADAPRDLALADDAR